MHFIIDCFIILIYVPKIVYIKLNVYKICSMLNDTVNNLGISNFGT